jgi:hypothetical protein
VLDAVPERPVRAAPQRETDDAIDLIGTAGLPVLKRLAPLLAGLLAFAVLFAALRRRRT